jgi:alpha-1,3-mannosyl-glycoprotein beta-1,2-N-acetylglucosaminyltransferase
VKWPRAYWDDWLREPKQRQSRQIIRPEVCRTFHFGIRGTSNAQYSDYMSRIRLNDQYVAFDELDLSYLEKEKYDSAFLSRVHAAQEMTVDKLLSLGRGVPKTDVKIVYERLSDGPKNFEDIARRLGVMDNIKARVPRTAYKGVVTFWYGGTRVYLVPLNPLY